MPHIIADSEPPLLNPSGESQLRRLLGFATRDAFEDFLAAHHVYRNHMLDDLAQDRRTAQQLNQ